MQIKLGQSEQLKDQFSEKEKIIIKKITESLRVIPKDEKTDNCLKFTIISSKEAQVEATAVALIWFAIKILDLAINPHKNSYIEIKTNHRLVIQNCNNDDDTSKEEAVKIQKEKKQW
jgi:hypothetical protein